MTNHDPSPGRDTLPAALLVLVEQLCDRFEDARREGRPIDPGGLLGEAPEAIRPALLRELLHLDLAYRPAADRPAAQAEYQARFPDYSAVVEDVARSRAAETGSYDSSPGPCAPPQSATAGSTEPDGRRPSDPPSGGPPRTPAGGLVIPGYAVEEVLGWGAMGVVFRARHLVLNRPAAVKTTRGPAGADPKIRIRFLAEAEAAAAIDHPHVARVYDFGQVDGRPYMALEFCPGGTLAGRLAPPDPGSAGGPPPSGRQLDPVEAAGLLARITRGVAAAHAAGVVHRDLKPANVLFDAAGEPKVADFGLAKVGAGSDITHTQSVMGTPAYMAPEQAAGRTKFAGPPADVWALGVILYECLTGVRPFTGADTGEVLHAVVHHDPRPARTVRPGLPRDLDLIVRTCLEKAPGDRYPSAAELADDLERFGRDEPVSVREPGAAERVMKWARRKPAVAGLYAAAGLGLMLIAVSVGFALLAREAHAARGAATTALNIAEQERDSARIARDELEIQKQLVEDARQKLALIEYGRTIQLAQRECLGHHQESARLLLEGTRVDLRGWEWHYVHQQCKYGHLFTLKGHKQRAVASFSPDGSQVVTGSGDGTVKLWDAKSGAEVLTLHSTGGVQSVSMCPDGKRIVAALNDGMVCVWDAAAPHDCLVLRGHTASATCASFAPDGSRIVTGSSDRTVKLWDAKTGAVLHSLTGHSQTVFSASFNRDGSQILTASQDATARVWDAKSGKEVRIIDKIGRVPTASFSPDGTRIITTSRQKNEVTVWDARTGTKLMSVGEHYYPVNCASFSPDGSRILTGSIDGTARVWDAKSGNQLLIFRGHDHEVRSASFSPDGRHIVTGSDDKTVRLWDAKIGIEVLTQRRDVRISPVHSTSPDGSRVATPAQTKNVRVTDAKSGAEVTNLIGHNNKILAVSFSPDGSRIVTGSSDNTARVWDVRTGAQLLSLVGHTTDRHDYDASAFAGVSAASFSPDGARIVTGGADKTVRVWDARSGAELLTLTGHIHPVLSASFSPDGMEIIASNVFGIVKIWAIRR